MSGSFGGRSVRYALVLCVLAACCAVAATVSLCAGNVSVPFSHVLRILFFHAGDARECSIILKIRLPRLLMVLLLGGALSLSGFLLQTYFQNPIAGPFVLGISSGAKMTVALSLVFAARLTGTGMSSWLLIAASFAGALLSTFFILLVARRVHHSASLLVSGIMIGYITSAVTDFIITFAEDADIVNLHGWSKGSFSGMSMENFYLCALIIGVAVLCTVLIAKPVGAYRFGEQYAQSMGVNIKIIRPVLILLSSILSACVTAFAGPVSFVGIAVPFLIKRCMGTAEPLLLIPGCFLGGAVFCTVSDLVARLLFAPLEMNISTVTSFFGAPVVIFMLLKKKTAREA